MSLDSNPQPLAVPFDREAAPDFYRQGVALCMVYIETCDDVRIAQQFEAQAQSILARAKQKREKLVNQQRLQKNSINS